MIARTVFQMSNPQEFAGEIQYYIIYITERMHCGMEQNRKEHEMMAESMEEIRQSWQEICKAFGIENGNQITKAELRRSLKQTVMELYQLEQMECIQKTGKQVPDLHILYVTDLIQFLYLLAGDERGVWSEECDQFIRDVFTSELFPGQEFSVYQKGTMEEMLESVNRVFSIANQFAVIRTMEENSDSACSLPALEENYIYAGIALVQACNDNMIMMGKTVTFIKAVIKINDNIVKYIAQTLGKFQK